MSTAPPTREWGLLLKVHVGSEAPAATPEQLERLLGELPGRDKRFTGGGRDFTVAWWVAATDAATATRLGAAAVRQAAGNVGLGELRFVRSHAASIEGRYPAFPVSDADVAVPGRWAVDLKVGLPQGDGAATADLLPRVQAALAHLAPDATLHGDLEKFLLDDGTGFTLRFWAAGETIESALDAAGAEVRRALQSVGVADGVLVRLKAWGPASLRGDEFPGASSRIPEPTGELR